MTKAKTISDAKLKYAVGMVKKQIEPKIKQIVEAFNDLLESRNIRAGLELQWFFDELEDKSNENKT